MWKGITKLRNKDFTWINFVLLCLGIFLMISTGFTWWKLLGVVALTSLTDISAGIIGSSMLLMRITFGIMQICSVETIREYSWISVLLISLSFFLLFYHYVLTEKDERITKIYLGKNLYWYVVAVLYVALSRTGISIQNDANTAWYERVLGHEMADTLLDINLLYTGIAGTVFCLVWIVREKILIFIDNHRGKRR